MRASTADFGVLMKAIWRQKKVKGRSSFQSQYAQFAVSGDQTIRKLPAA